jgi:hypothetical protein
LALSLYIGPELIYIDVTPVAGKGKNMLFLEQQRHLLDVKAQLFLNSAPSIGRKDTTCFSLKNSAIYWT